MGDLQARLRATPSFVVYPDDEQMAALHNEAADRIDHLLAEIARLKEALDVKAIRQLEHDVRFYSGNEASGYAEIARRKASAWERAAALQPSETRKEGI